MVDVGRQFLCKVIRDGQLAPALEHRIGPEHIADQSDRAVYDLVLEHWRTYGKVPARSIVLKNYPNWKFIEADEPMEYYLAEVSRSYRYGVLKRAINEVVAMLNEGPEQLDEAVATNVVALHAVNAVTIASIPDEEILATAEERARVYRERLHLVDGLLGISTGFPTVDQATLGLQPEQFVLVIGPPAAGKSTLLLRLAVNVVERPDSKVLFVGFEMSNDEQMARADAMFAQISHRRYITGELTRSEERQRAERVAWLRSQDSRLVMIGDRAGVLTVSALAAKIEEHKPELVVVDGLYLMSDEHGEASGSPQALTNITRNIKQLAQRVGVPILASTQALKNKMGRMGVSLDSIGYSSSFAQDADVIIGVQPCEEDPGMMDTRLIKVRSGPRGELRIDADWEKGTFRETSGAVDA